MPQKILFSDADIEHAKPGESVTFGADDIASAAAPKPQSKGSHPPQSDPWSLDRLVEVGQQTAGPGIGALKGAANTVIGMGQAAYRHVPGVAAVSDAVGNLIAPDTKMSGEQAFTAARAAVQPTTAGQRAGYTAEQLAEFFIPASKAGKAANLAKDVGLSYLQTGDPTTAATTGVVGAVLPMAGKVVKGASQMLGRGAEKSVAQALGASKEWAKSEAAKLAPEMIARGISGSRSAMLEQATAKVAEIGPRIGQIYKTAGESGQTISGLVLRGELQLAKDALMVPNAAGVMVPIEGAQRVARKLDRMERWVESLGDDVPVHHAAKIATLWQKIVAKSGLYGQKAGASATDAADAWAMREGTSSIRQLLNDVNPDLPALNREFAFWKGLKNVLKETEQRTQAQTNGLLNAVGATGGGAAGAMATMLAGGGPAEVITGAFVTQKAAQTFLNLIRSPWWKTSVSAPTKDHLARALASGNKNEVAAAMARITAGLPSQARQALAN